MWIHAPENAKDGIRILTGTEINLENSKLLALNGWQQCLWGGKQKTRSGEWGFSVFGHL